MALSPEQIAFTAEIVRETYASVASAVSSLNTAQEFILSGDIDLWELERNAVDLRVKGEGIDLNTDRLLAQIFYRTRSMLGYPLIPYDQGEPVLSLMELEVGHNFG